MIRRYPFPYVPTTLFAVVDGTVQPVTDVEPEDPDGGTYQLAADPEDAQVFAYARISPDAISAPPESDGLPILEDPEDTYEEDTDLVDALDDETEDDDPDAPTPPDDPA